MQIKYGQALIDGEIQEHPITPSVSKRLEKDLKMKIGTDAGGDTEASMMIWMAFQNAGATELGFDAWLDTTMATDVRLEDVPFGLKGQPTGEPSPSPSSPVTD